MTEKKQKTQQYAPVRSVKNVRTEAQTGPELNRREQQNGKQTHFREMFHNGMVGLQIMFQRLSCHGD